MTCWIPTHPVSLAPASLGAALVGILFLGPRIGKYGPGGKVNVIPGHNMTSAAIGTFVLWFGWFGFNPGSTMAADGASIAHIATTTNVAAAAGTLSSMITAWLLLKKPDLGITLVPRVLHELERALRTDRVGDGKIFVTPVDDAVRVRTGDRGEDAL